MSPAPASVTAMAEKRVRRQKIFIAVGSVLLLAILGFELPKMLGGGGNEASGVTTAPAGTLGAAPTGAAPVVPPGKLPNTDRIVVQRDSSQLISFGLFKTKDPFVQQLATSAAETTPGATPSAPAPAGATPTPGGSTVAPSAPTPAVVPPGAVSTPSATTPSAPGSTPSTITPTAPAPAPTDALIAVNGVCERVSVKGTFPTDENIFRLVSIARDGKSVEIGVVGGSYDSGQATATLKQGGKLTLVNTADGTRYEIALKASCTLAAPAGTTTQAAGSTTPIAPTPSTTAATTTTTATTTATTPIVTDSLDTTTPGT
ncbi:MAG TPA: hypothetical protein VH816_00175 [Gaiellaceae bacterium]|jgi:hypothetical protein